MSLEYGVYFIYCGEGQNSPVKIGVTSDIEKRLSSLQTGNPYPLICKALIPCSSREQAYRLEAYLHKRLRKSRMVGEWFRIHRFNLKALLNDFSRVSDTPIEKQGYNVIKKSNKEIKSLKKQNNELRMIIGDLESQIEEMEQLQIVKNTSDFI